MLLYLDTIQENIGGEVPSQYSSLEGQGCGKTSNLWWKKIKGKS